MISVVIEICWFCSWASLSLPPIFGWMLLTCFPSLNCSQDDDLVVSELIAVVVCHNRFSFLGWCASGLPETKKAQPI